MSNEEQFNESDYESIEDDIKSENEDTIDILDFLEKNIIDNSYENRTMYKITLSQLYYLYDNKTIFLSKLNRVINMNRVDEAFKELSLENCDPIILANINGKDGFEILDGQHRLLYFVKNRKTLKGDSEIYLDLRFVENEAEYCKLLNIINNRMNFSTGQLNKYILLGIKEELSKKLKNKTNKDIYGKNRPRIDWEKLQTILINTKTYKNSDNKVDDIVNKLVRLNNMISTNMSKYSEYFKNTNMEKRALHFHLFLGIDKSYKLINLIDEF